MRNCPRLPALTLALIAVLSSARAVEELTPAWGPIPENLFIVLKAREYQQLGPGLLSPYPGNNHFFEVLVAPSPDNTSISGYPFIDYVVDDAFESETLFFDGTSYELFVDFDSAANLNTAFPDGTEYSLTIPINEVNQVASFIIDANLDEVTFFPQPEILSLENAFWSDGILFIPNPSLTVILELNTGALTELFSQGLDIILAVMDGEAKFSRDLISSLAIGPGGDFELTPGYHTLFLDYVNVIDDFFPGTPIPDFTGFVGYDSLTSISIYVIPEPRTYALLLGGLALAGVSFHRFRRKRTEK